jgi:hypothetical protein
MLAALAVTDGGLRGLGAIEDTPVAGRTPMIRVRTAKPARNTLTSFWPNEPIRRKTGDWDEFGLPLRTPGLD